MYNVTYNIKITQRTNGRTGVLVFDFVEKYEWDSSWKNMTDKGTISLPKNLYYTDEDGAKHPLAGSTANVGGYTENPFFMRGDKISLESGYSYFNKAGVQIFESRKIFDGYISKVNSGIPIELEVEDSMWVLKQTPLANKTYKSTDSLESIMKDVIAQVNKTQGTALTYRALNVTNFGQLIVNNETAAQLLNRLHKTFGFNSYFRDEELRCGSLIYVESDSSTQTFIMNGVDGNVLAEGQELVYQRKDDIKISALAHNTIEQLTGESTKDNKPKTKQTRLEVLVSIVNGKRIDRPIAKGEVVPANEDGERMTFFFPSAKNTKDLADLASAKLIQNYYTGLKGKFIVYGIPYVRHGDYVLIKNPQQPEQNGRYKVKAVTYTGGTDGNRQEIEIDYKSDFNIIL